MCHSTLKERIFLTLDGKAGAFALPDFTLDVSHKGRIVAR
jgi:hypothetical protein